jgi:cyclopropane fatty-acyl-phospholipid synthase-like methyltransferase
LKCVGYDGNPDTPTLTKGIGQVLDLSEPFDLETTFDWVVSLEVGEHLPHQYETIFIENLMRHAEKGIILSWALKNQPGAGHFNCQNNDYIKAIFAKYGYINDVEAETLLRADCSAAWFTTTVMVFRAPQN